MHLLRLVGPLGSIFGPSATCFKNDFEKTSKKIRKSWIWASQNLPKILPKCFQNRCPQRHAIFHRFLLDLLCLLQRPNLKFRAPTQCFVDVAQKTHLGFSHAFCIQKTYRKPFQNDVRTLQKSMPKTCCFLTSIFSGFGLDFGAS